MLLFPAAVAVSASLPRTRPLRRPAEQHPLQNRQVSPQLPHLSVPLRIPLAQPGVVRPQQRVLRTQLASHHRQLPVQLHSLSQRIPQRRLSIPRNRDHASRDCHAAQQTPSASANHASRTGVSWPAAS
jgi:hypothetical protein